MADHPAARTVDRLRKAVADLRARIDVRPELDAELLMDKVRCEVESRLVEEAERTPAALESPRAAFSVPWLSPGPTAIEMRADYSLGELLAFNDHEFVRNAYRALLHREPDPVGFAAHVHALGGEDVSRIEMLANLRRSEEGRLRKVRVRGLGFAVTLRRMMRLPVLGNFLALLVYAPRLLMIVRNIERQESLVARRDRELRAAVDGALDAVSAAVARLERDKASRDLSIRMARRLAAMRFDFSRLAAGLAERASYEDLQPLTDSVLDSATQFALALERLDPAMAALEARAGVADSAIQRIEGRVAQVDAAKADEKEVAARILQVTSSMDGKAEAKEVAARILQVTSSMDGKAEARDVSLRFQAVWGALDQKAGANDVAFRLDALRDDLDRRLDGVLVRDRLEAALRQGDQDLDSFYVAFENEFRGTRDEVKQRMSVYLPLIEKARAGRVNTPVLDLGCGRGEWLEVLGTHDLVASGVDLNEAMVAEARRHRVDVVHGDAIIHLRGLEAGSLGAVCAMHLIEHLPLQALITLFDETFRALRPGGIAIFETPNPENLLVGACNFWFDPTHIRPIPPDAARFMATSRGFARCEILRLHPYPETERVKDGAQGVRERLNAFLYGPQDYALIAFKE